MTSSTDSVSLKLCNGSSLPLELHEAAISSLVLTKLKVLNNCWVSVQLILDARESLREDSIEIHKNGSCEKPDMVVKLVLFEDLLLLGCDMEIISNLKSDAIYIREETAFNVLYGYINSYQSFTKSDCPLVNVLPLKSGSFGPSLAKNVIVSIVRSPNAPQEGTYDESLKNYFKKRKHLNLNQVFKVDYSDCDMQYFGHNQCNHCLWFKVISIESENHAVRSALVKDGVTTLYVKGSANSFVPIIRKQSELSCRTENLTKGLEKYLLRIKDIMKLVIEQRVAACDSTLLIHGQPAIGKRLLMRHLCEQYCMHFYDVNCFDVIGESIAAVEQRIEGIFNKAMNWSPCVLLLRNIHALSKDKDGDETEPRLINCFSKFINNMTSSESIVIVAATTNSHSEVSTELCRCFIYDVEIEAPDEQARLETLIGITQDYDVSDCCLASLAKKTAGMVLGDLRMLVSKALGITRARIENDVCSVGGKPQLNQADVDLALENVHTEYKDSLGMPKIPDVSWSDIGGLADVKSEIIDTIKIPLLYPELTSKGLRRSGLLLYGPPGCGKTLLAKAVATEFSLNFFSVKGPELINMYVGQSEQNVRDMFKKARECSPCVVFFDELDSIAPNRGKSGDSGGVMDRVVSQLLAELDGMQTSNELFVIGATNRPDLLDNALLRPGRFDKLVYVGFPETKTDRMNIMKSYTDKMSLDGNVNLEKIEDSLPLFLTGADFYALCSDAVLNAIRRRIKEIENEAKNEEYDLTVLMNDFEAASKDLVPSVSTEDVLKYKEIKRKVDFEKNATVST